MLRPAVAQRPYRGLVTKPPHRIGRAAAMGQRWNGRFYLAFAQRVFDLLAQKRLQSGMNAAHAEKTFRAFNAMERGATGKAQQPKRRHCLARVERGLDGALPFGTAFCLSSFRCKEIVPQEGLLRESAEKLDFAFFKTV